VQVLIRDYRPEDLAQILQLWDQTTVADSGGRGLAVEQVIRLLSDERAIVLVADMDGRLAARCWRHSLPSPPGSIG